MFLYWLRPWETQFARAAPWPSRDTAPWPLREGGAISSAANRPVSLASGRRPPRAAAAVNNPMRKHSSCRRSVQITPAGFTFVYSRARTAGGCLAVASRSLSRVALSEQPARRAISVASTTLPLSVSVCLPVTSVRAGLAAASVRQLPGNTVRTESANIRPVTGGRPFRRRRG